MVDLICGYWHLDGTNAQSDVLRAMAAAMTPATATSLLEVWHEGPIGLARLSIGPRAPEI